MSEAPATAATAVAAPTSQTPSSSEDLGEAGVKALEAWKTRAREAEKQAKLNADAAAKLAAFEESQKTEAQKLADRAADAEKKASEAANALTRYQVALRHGLSESDIEDLNWSGTDEEIEKRIQRFKERQAKSVRPGGSVDQGPRGAAPAQGPAQEFASFLSNQMRSS